MSDKSKRDAQALRSLAKAFIDGMCSCNSPSGSLTGHSMGCPVADYRAQLKRCFNLANRLNPYRISSKGLETRGHANL